MKQILFRLDTFEGPLDLLLKLISKHKLNIYDIEISKLLEQYMEYLDNSNIQNLESAGEFLEMASRLIYIKTAYLLPKPEADEAQQMKKELETNLIEYSSIKYASSVLAEKFQGDNVFVRRPMKVKAEYSYNQMYLPDRLAMAYLNISFPEDIEAENKIIENKINSAVKRKITSVISKVVFILRRLYGSGKKLLMDSLYEGVYDRSERVATFLAVLELTKNGRIKISDDNSEIYFTGRKKKGIFSPMEINEQLAVAEAVIFASGEPVEIVKIAEILETSPENAVKLVRILNERYDEYKSGIRIISVNGRFQMTTRAEYAGYVRKALNLKKNTPLSPASMEVLTIIAYNQPVSRGFIENIRGTDSSSAVNSLCEKELIEEAGRLDVPGKPIVYRTTDKFLRCFGLGSLEDLPPLPERNNPEKESKI